jgi:hypothetical protein
MENGSAKGMNREESEQLADHLAQTLLEKEGITFEKLCGVKIILRMELYKELVKPLEKVCAQMDAERFVNPDQKNSANY